MRLILALLASISLSCATNPRQCRDSRWPVPADSLQYRADDLQAELQRAIAETDLTGLPPEPREFVAGIFREKFEVLEKAKAGGAEIWKFRYEKCPNCGWYRSGYVAVRGCRIVEEVETSDEM